MDQIRDITNKIAVALETVGLINIQFAIKDDKVETVEGVHDDPTMTMTADSADYIGIFTGEVDGMAAFMQGKLKLAGDLNLAMKLTQMFKVR